MSQILISTMAFNDEFSEPPTSWQELNSMSAILLASGTASSTNNFNTIDLRGDHYSMTQSDQQSGSNIIFTYNCVAKDPKAANYNVEGCVSLFNGATDIQQGNGTTPAQTVDCT